MDKIKNQAGNCWKKKKVEKVEWRPTIWNFLQKSMDTKKGQLLWSHPYSTTMKTQFLYEIPLKKVQRNNVDLFDDPIIGGLKLFCKFGIKKNDKNFHKKYTRASKSVIPLIKQAFNQKT